MIMKKILMLATVVLLLALGAGTALAQSGYDLFQKALVKERAVGDVEEALRLYQRIVKEFSGNHALAAKAELRMGLLYDRLGRKADAQRSYQAVVNQYADQTSEARQARAKIVVVAPPRRSNNANVRTTTGLTARQVWGDSNIAMGLFLRGAGPAAISTDGLHLVYVSSNGALYVRDIPSGENRRLTIVGSAWDMERVTSGPALSPDGKVVAYRWRFDENGRTDLRLIAFDGSAPRVLNRSDEWANLEPFDWSPDGKQILALARGQNGTRQIVLVSVADGSVHSLKTLDGDPPGKMSFSHDGRYIVYDYAARGDSPPARDSVPAHDIFILDADGSHEARRITQAADNRYSLWTPDGKGVVFLSRLAASGRKPIEAWFLRIVDGAPQGSPERLKDMGWAIPIGFTRNGSLYYTLRSEMNDLYVATLDPTSGMLGSQPKTITQRYVNDNDGTWSPNGQYIAYGSRRASVKGEVGAALIVIHNVATGEESEIAPALNGFDLRGGWSPDSRYLLMEGGDKTGRGGIYRVDARTGDVTPLVYATPGEHGSHPSWFANGKSIVFLRRPSASGERIVSLDLETHKETELYRPPAGFLLGSCLEVSNDEQRMAFYLRDQKTRSNSVMVISAPGEKPRELGPQVRYPEVIDDILALTPDGKYVLFTTDDREEEQLGHKFWRIAVEGGSGPQEIQFPKDIGYFGTVSFHPDGRQLTFVADNSKSAVWVMDNFLPSTPNRKTSVSRR
jgi:Tol biopolymer transport system component